MFFIPLFGRIHENLGKNKGNAGKFLRKSGKKSERFGRKSLFLGKCPFGKHVTSNHKKNINLFSPAINTLFASRG